MSGPGPTAAEKDLKPGHPAGIYFSDLLCLLGPVRSDSLRPGMLHQALPNTRAVLSKGEVIVA
jgi:hypothetical protein